MSTSTSLTKFEPFDPDRHVCPECSQRKEHKEFHFAPGGIPIICKQCRKDQKIAHARERLEMIATKNGIADLAHISRQKIDSPHISQLCESLIHQWGGLTSFTNFFFSQIQAAAAERPGSKAVLDACKTVIGLVNQSTEHRKSAPDVVDMTDAELERERTRLVLQLVTRDPTGEAIQILKELNLGTYDDGNGRGTPESPATPEASISGEGSSGERPAGIVRTDASPGPDFQVTSND